MILNYLIGVAGAVATITGMIRGDMPLEIIGISACMFLLVMMKLNDIEMEVTKNGRAKGRVKS